MAEKPSLKASSKKPCIIEDLSTPLRNLATPLDEGGLDQMLAGAAHQESKICRQCEKISEYLYPWLLFGNEAILSKTGDDRALRQRSTTNLARTLNRDSPSPCSSIHYPSFRTYAHVAQ